LIDKVKDGVVDLVLRLVTAFVKYALGGLLLPISLAFAGVGVATNVITANENKKEENKVIVYGSGVSEETTYNDVAVEEETIIDVVKEDIINNNEEKTKDEQVEEDLEVYPLTLDEFLEFNNNSSFEEVFTAYDNYAVNYVDFDFPYAVEGYSASENGAYVNFCKPYANQLQIPVTFFTDVGNVHYRSRPKDMNKILDHDYFNGDFDWENETEVFAKITYAEIDGKWYVVSDEPCSISNEELSEIQGAYYGNN